MAKNNRIGTELPVLVAVATEIHEAIKHLRPFAKVGAKLEPVVGSLRDSLDAILVKILRDHFSKVVVRLDPRRPQRWDDNFAVLEIVVDGKTFRIPVPKLRDLEPGIFKKMRKDDVATIFVRDSKVSEILLTGMGYGRGETPKSLAQLGADGVWQGSVRTLDSAPTGYQGGSTEFEVSQEVVQAAILSAADNLGVKDFEISWVNRPMTAQAGDKFFVFPFDCPEVGQVGSNFACPNCGAPYRAGLGEVGLGDDRNIHLPTGKVYLVFNWLDPNPGIPWEPTGFLFYGGKSVVLEDGQWEPGYGQRSHAVQVSRVGGKIRIGASGGDGRFWLFELEGAEEAIRKMLLGVPFFTRKETAPEEIQDRIMDLF